MRHHAVGSLSERGSHEFQEAAVSGGFAARPVCSCGRQLRVYRCARAARLAFRHAARCAKPRSRPDGHRAGVSVRFIAPDPGQLVAHPCLGRCRSWGVPTSAERHPRAAFAASGDLRREGRQSPLQCPNGVEAAAVLRFPHGGSSSGTVVPCSRQSLLRCAKSTVGADRAAPSTAAVASAMHPVTMVLFMPLVGML